MNEQDWSIYAQVKGRISYDNRIPPRPGSEHRKSTRVRETKVETCNYTKIWRYDRTCLQTPELNSKTKG